mgnify:CR=1 FL=1
MADSVIEDYITPAVEDKKARSKKAPAKSKDVPVTEDDEDTAAKRESLAILATLGTSKDFIGVDMSLGDVRKMSQKDVEKYYVRYQAVLGRRVTGGLTESVIDVSSKGIAYHYL